MAEKNKYNRNVIVNPFSPTGYSANTQPVSVAPSSQNPLVNTPAATKTYSGTPNTYVSPSKGYVKPTERDSEAEKRAAETMYNPQTGTYGRTGFTETSKVPTTTPDGGGWRDFGENMKAQYAQIKGAVESPSIDNILGLLSPPQREGTTNLASISLPGGAWFKSAGSVAAKAAAGAIPKDVGQFYTNMVTGGAGKIATNSVSMAKTSSFLSKIVAAAGKPQVIVGAILGAIGSYPFAGFIKEEALQQSTFAYSSAEDKGDIQGMENALQMEGEILNPDIWTKIMEVVPYANVLSNLKSYFDTSVSNHNDRIKRLENLKAGNPTAEDLKYQKIAEDKVKAAETARAEELRQREEDTAYFAKIEENKKLAEKQGREELSKYYQNIQDREDERDATQRQQEIAQLESIRKMKEEQQKKDTEYWAKVNKQREESTPSKLKFGII